MRSLSEARGAYADALARRDGDAAAAVVTDLLEGGLTPADVLTEIVGASQREVGGRWQRGEWSVAEEHAATAISMAATTVVQTFVERTPATRGHVLIACAEREWHELPALIVACALRAAGWQTTLLGASTSPLRLNQYLQDLGPEAVAVSCSVLGSLPAARRFVEASTRSGVPILVGGPAFGPDARRATGLGATAWAGDAHAAVAAMETLPAVVGPVRPLDVAVADELAALDLENRSLVARLRAQWSASASEGEAALLPTGFSADAVRQLLHAVAAALLTGDPRPIPETTAWIAELLAARSVSGYLAEELVGLLLVDLDGYPQARRIVAQYISG